MDFLRRLSIQNKLLLSMSLCMLLLIAVFSVLSYVTTSKSIRERVETVELPAQVASIRNDIRQQIAGPLAVSLALADNTFLQAWEDAGLPESGEAAWKELAGQLKTRHQVASAFWASQSHGKFYSNLGFERQLRLTAGDEWFPSFLSNGLSYELNIDRDKGTDVYMMFINTRVRTPGGKLAATGLGLSVDELARSVRNFKLGESGAVYMVRADGSLLIHRDPALVQSQKHLQDLPGLTPALSNALLKGEQYAHARFSGPQGMQLIASSFVPELNAYVVAQVPEAEVLGGVGRAAALNALVAALIGGGFGLFATFLISRTIVTPVMRASRLLSDIIASGDLTRRMPVESKDEIGTLATAFNHFVSSLNTTMMQVQASSKMIAGATNDVASGNTDLSTRTQAQRGHLEKTASAMEQLTATVRQNADNASQANTLVASTSESAVKGGAVVSQVVDMMGAITASSHKIADIISVIDGIAFQTNILALNAAVEAARAGEQGRGFAVVASEVRSLAQRSAAAAREIKELITDSVQQVEAGSKLADTAGGAMQEIVNSVRGVAALMTQIAMASQDQSDGIGDVNQSVMQMDQATQQNAALVEQAAAAARALQEQTIRLEQIVGAFQLESAKTPLLAR